MPERNIGETETKRQQKGNKEEAKNKENRKKRENQSHELFAGGQLPRTSLIGLQTLKFIHESVIQDKIRIMTSLSSFGISKFRFQIFEMKTKQSARSAGADDQIVKQEYYARWPCSVDMHSVV